MSQFYTSRTKTLKAIVPKEWILNICLRYYSAAIMDDLKENIEDDAVLVCKRCENVIVDDEVILL